MMGKARRFADGLSTARGMEKEEDKRVSSGYSVFGCVGSGKHRASLFRNGVLEGSLVWR